MKGYQIILLLIFFLAVFIRFFKLASIPDGFFVDESAIGYNAYSILKTGRDEWGNFLPLYFKSTGDYKLPVYIYAVIPFIIIFGLNEFAVRALSAAAGSLTVLAVYFLASIFASEIWKDKNKIRFAALLSALFLAFEPWHIHFSRIALETNVSLCFSTWGLLFLFKKKPLRNWQSFLGFFLLFLAFFTYLAPRLFLLIFLFFLFWIDKTRKRKWFIGFLIYIFLFLTTVFLSPQTLSRVKGISLFHQHSLQGIEAQTVEKIKEHQNKNIWVRLLHNKGMELGLTFIKQYLGHFSFDFLFLEGEKFNLRLKMPFIGNLLLFELPFFLIGFYLLLKAKNFILPFWIFCAPFPSSLSFQSPSSLRSIFMLVAFEIISAIGLVYLYCLIIEKKEGLKIFLIFLLALLYGFNLIYFFDNYFVHQLVHQPYFWNYDFKKVVLKASKLENNYEQIVIGEEGATLSHFLFFLKINPYKIWEEIQRRNEDVFGFVPPLKWKKYLFDPQCRYVQDNGKKTLYICKNEVNDDEVEIIDRIYYRDKKVNFTFFEKNK